MKRTWLDPSASWPTPKGLPGPSLDDARRKAREGREPLPGVLVIPVSFLSLAATVGVMFFSYWWLDAGACQLAKMRMLVSRIIVFMFASS